MELDAKGGQNAQLSLHFVPEWKGILLWKSGMVRQSVLNPTLRKSGEGWGTQTLPVFNLQTLSFRL
jgi:hypothetical protein